MASFPYHSTDRLSSVPVALVWKLEHRYVVMHRKIKDEHYGGYNSSYVASISVRVLRESFNERENQRLSERGREGKWNLSLFFSLTPIFAQ